MAYSDEMKIFAGTASSSLSERICAHLGTACGNAAVTHFEDGEIRVQFQENIRGKDVFLVNSTSPPVNDHLIELLILIDAARRASAARITAVLPYFGYARQDRKDRPRVPITAKLVSNLIVAAGADRVLTVDLHCDQIQGFFDIPVDHLSSEIAFTRHFRQLRPSEDLVVVSPDTGSVHRIRRFANRLEAPLAIVDKRRPKANVSEVMNLIGEVKDRHALIFDDLIDTGGTLVKAAEAIKARGSNAGRAAIDPRILFALWLYATLQGVGSGRELARLSDEHDAYRWICGGVSVNYHALNDFRSGNAELMDELLTANVASLAATGAITLERVAQDGMRVRASAGAASLRREASLREHLQEAQELVQTLKEQAERDPGLEQRRAQAARQRAARERQQRQIARRQRLVDGQPQQIRPGNDQPGVDDHDRRGREQRRALAA